MTRRTATKTRPPIDLDAAAKALSHPARIKILRFLARQSACFCGKIVDHLPLAQSTVSQHLRELKEAGLIRGAIDGTKVCYCIEPDAVHAAAAQFASLFAEILASEASCLGDGEFIADNACCKPDDDCCS